MSGLLYYLPNARSDDQREKMIRLERDGICIFCPPHFGVANGKPLEFENSTWYAAENQYPYQGTRVHLLIVPKAHVTARHELSAEARMEYWQILDEIVAHYGLTHYGTAARNGLPGFTGGTIRHYHEQFTVGSGIAGDPPVVLYMSSAPK